MISRRRTPTENVTDTLAVMAGLEAFAPLIEAAEGMRLDLLRRGWGEAAAEGIAGTWLCGAMTYTWQHQS